MNTVGVQLSSVKWDRVRPSRVNMEGVQLSSIKWDIVRPSRVNMEGVQLSSINGTKYYQVESIRRESN